MTLMPAATLGDRLDLLERRGVRWFDSRERRRAARRALLAAMQSSVIVPVIAFACAMVRPLPWTVALIAAVLVPLSVWIGVLLIARRPGPTSLASLALVDRRLNLGDRAVIASEFLNLPARRGFHEAALKEAAPWLEGAIGRPIADDEVDWATCRRAWPLPLIGASLLVFTSLIGYPGGDAGPAVREGDPHAAAATDPSRAKQMTNPLLAMFERARAALPGAGSAGTTTGASGSTPDGAPERPRVGGSGSGAASEPAPEDHAGGATSRADMGAGSGDAGASGDAAGAAMSGADETAAVAGKSASGKKAGSSADASSSQTRNAEAQRAQPRATAGVSPPDASGWPGGALPAAAGNSGTPGTPRDGSGGQGNRRSSSSAQGDSGSGNGNSGQNQGGPGSSGQDSIKRSRGLAGLILAVPMEDKLIGTPGPGPARTRLRRAAPVTGDVPVGAGDARGAQNGSVGQASRRIVTPQDERLVARYFDRGGGR